MNSDFKLTFILSVKNRRLEYDFTFWKTEYSSKMNIGNNRDFCVNTICQEADENRTTVSLFRRVFIIIFSVLTTSFTRNIQEAQNPEEITVMLYGTYFFLKQ